MRRGRDYGELNKTQRKVIAEQQFHEAGRQTTVREAMSAEPSPEHQVTAPEPNAVAEIEARDAQRAAYIERLDAMVAAKKIDSHELRYRLDRFENGNPVEADRKALQERAAARDALNQHIERGNAGQPLEKGPDVGRKPDDIER